MVHIEVDEGRCDGFGFCEQAAPEVFGLDDDGVVTVLLDEIPDELAEKAEAATRACPVAALKAAR
ncbi:ferredoxin [Streptomyces sp. NPDC048251]|uniref:ferredoxin n=1 Tax=Streptomyces sp. NPDC048251 TaxID=3154501 RepID=UPI003415CDF2